MRRSIPIAEAKNHLPAIIRELDRERVVTLTRHGKPVAVLLADSEYRRLNRRGSFAHDLAAFRRRLEENEGAITDEDLEGLRDRSEGRATSL
ncbi:MAG: type II toxin-antitoxin system Phd/YefM family antitoxin [Desulfobacterales bacterium]|jgi:prevent-host-death family protein|nr:type II toxin-antitoxin system Phd/YefM family antitoxin [Desulfobacterales bacterium]